MLHLKASPSIQPSVGKEPAVKKQVGRQTPHARELEESVLGALLLERDALTEVVDILKPESFYVEAHAEIYRAILALFNQSQSVDLRTVVHQLRKQGTLDMVGGAMYIAHLTDRIVSSAHVENHARIIIEYAIRRALISIASKVQRDAYDDTIDTFLLLDQSEQALFEVTDSNIRKSYDTVSALMGSVVRELEAKGKQNGLSGVPSGISGLDKLLMGWQPADFIVLAARPGMGKTAFMLTLLRNAALDHNCPVAFFSLEMSSVQIMQRLLSAESELTGDTLKRGQLKEYEWEQLSYKTSNLSQAPIYIDDTPALSLFEFRAKCRRLKAQHNIGLVCIDYLQLMRGEGGNREQEIAHISRGIKAVSKELNIPIIAASQLSRAVETRGGDRRPQLSDLRESGAIEQDVDIALFLYRAAYYGLQGEDEGESAVPGLTEIIIAKHRNGPLGKANMRFRADITKFENMPSGWSGKDSHSSRFTRRESKFN